MQERTWPNKIELAWAAGFFDGEGHVSCRPTRNSRSRAYRMYVQISQTDPEPLLRFKAAVHGVGVTHGPFMPKGPQWSPVWTYRANRFEQAQAVLAMLWPFLSGPKRRAAQIALESMAAWQAEMKATCRKGLHRLEEVGLTSVGSCAECDRIGRRRAYAEGRRR
jgi:hypothetical protein